MRKQKKKKIICNLKNENFLDPKLYEYFNQKFPSPD